MLLLALCIGGAVTAQLETADRGILPIDSSGTLEVTGIHVDVGGADATSARYGAGWMNGWKGLTKLSAPASANRSSPRFAPSACQRSQARSKPSHVILIARLTTKARACWSNGPVGSMPIATRILPMRSSIVLTTANYKAV